MSAQHIGDASLRHDNLELLALADDAQVVPARVLSGQANDRLVGPFTLAEQWRQRIGDLLGLQRREIGQLGAGQTRRSGIVDLVTLQTLARRDTAAEVFDDYGPVVVDECHHLPR